MSRERIHVLGARESRVVDDPETAVLIPREVTEEVVFGVDVVAERLGTEEGVEIAAVWELAEDLFGILSSNSKK